MSATPIQPYLMFGGRCQEALDFYAQAVGAQMEMRMLFKESPDPVPPGMLPPGFEDKIMHSSFSIGGNTIMASDGCTEGSSFGGFSLSYAVATATDAERIFAALADGGQVQMPLTKTFWSPCFGMLTDRFGLAWMVMVPGEPS
ncbi:VOC family protein [Oxalobacteraceae bacterium R-40]|uniref:VOC family protein n=1 Tax=Keguizhuia sedimenti TaxID=3064264 RepID=A0ABU1BS66_9BURK|nr:VOC family protein [Oxalobacteraceae bacterium R-40]